MLYLGLVIGLVAQNYAAHVACLDSLSVFVATLLLLIPALAGARLLFVAAHWGIYRNEPARIWRRSEGGAAMYGGLPLALLCSVPLLNLLSIPFARFWDVSMVTIFIGMIFTKFGCLLHGCCGGRATKGRFSLFLPDANGKWDWRFPTQLFEAGWAAILLLGIVVFWSRFPFDGAASLFSVAGYGAGRFVFECMRDEQGSTGRLTIGRVCSATTAVIALAVFFIMA
jgi:prolipoprotein diacylglyceryltransferase